MIPATLGYKVAPMMWKAIELSVLERNILSLVQAEDTGWMEVHDYVRDHAQAIYQQHFDSTLDEWARKFHHYILKHREEDAMALIGAFILLFEEPYTHDFESSMRTAGEAAHLYTESQLQEKQWGEPKERAKEFASLRLKDLENVPEEVNKRIREALNVSLHNGENPLAIARRFDEAIRKAKDIEGARMAATESQVAYGVVLYGTLTAAGFTHKRWISARDERVRESHRLCDEQGAILLTKPFQNGLRYPGQPDAPASEIVNCRCYLKGEKR